MGGCHVQLLLPNNLHCPRSPMLLFNRIWMTALDSEPGESISLSPCIAWSHCGCAPAAVSGTCTVCNPLLGKYKAGIMLGRIRADRCHFYIQRPEGLKIFFAREKYDNLNEFGFPHCVMEENHTLLCPVCFSSVRVKHCTTYRLQATCRGVFHRVNKTTMITLYFHSDMQSHLVQEVVSVQVTPPVLRFINYLTFLDGSNPLGNLIQSFQNDHNAAYFSLKGVRAFNTYKFLTVFLLKKEKNFL